MSAADAFKSCYDGLGTNVVGPTVFSLALGISVGIVNAISLPAASKCCNLGDLVDYVLVGFIIELVVVAGAAIIDVYRDITNSLMH